MISSATIIILVLDFLVGLALPIWLAIWLVKKYNCKIETILIGAGTFFLFALVLESLVHLVVLKSVPAIQENTLYYALYGGLMAGLFEETGRFVSMKFLLKKDNNHTALAYGVGHGGMEVIMVFAMSMFSMALIAIMSNMGKLDLLLAKSPDDPAALAQLEAMVESMQSAKPASYLIGLWERCSAVLLHIALSVLVFTAVRKGGRFIWLYPVAILLHALVDGIAVMMNGQVNTVVLEVVIMCMAIAIAGLAYIVDKKFKPSAEVAK